MQQASAGDWELSLEFCGGWGEWLAQVSHLELISVIRVSVIVVRAIKTLPCRQVFAGHNFYALYSHC